MATPQHETFRLETSGKIPYDRVEGPTMRISRDEERITETIRLKSTDVQAFRLEALPPPVFFFTGDSVVPPYRTLPGAPWMVVESLDFRPQSDELPGDPFEADTGAPANTYNDFYLCTITYRPWLEAEDQDRDTNDPETFLEVEKTGGAQFLVASSANTKQKRISSPGEEDSVKLPDGSTTTEDAAPESVNNALQMPITFMVPTVEYTLTWPLVLNPAFERLEAAMGKVNDAALPIFGNSPPETVLFMGYGARQRYVWDGASSRAQPWEIQYKFSKRAVNHGGRTFGWNHEFNDVLGEWVLITTANSNLKLHDSTDFLQLFLTR